MIKKISKAITKLRSTTRGRILWDYTLAIAAVSLAMLLTVHAQPLIQGNMLLLCLVAVTVSAWYGGVGPGLLATLLAIVATDSIFGLDTSMPGGVLIDRLRPSIFASVAILISALSQAKKLAELDLDRSLQTLENRVADRTKELRAANTALEAQIAERKQAEDAYRELFENASDMVYTVDLDGRFTSLNKVGERMTGLSAQEAQGLAFGEVVAQQQDGESIGEMLAELLGGAAPRAHRIELLERGGARVPAETTVRLIYRDGAPVGAQGIARDLTERERLEAELRQSNKLEAIGRLAGGVAHDFNNILMVIQGYGEMLLSQLEPTQPLFRDLDEIHKAAKRGSGLTRQLLAFGRKQVLRISPLDLNSVVSNIAQMLTRSIGENITLNLRLGGQACPIEADGAQLEQVLVNLAVNARDAMARGGELTIEVAKVTVEGAHHPMAPGRYVRLTVRDNGTGMDEATQARLFEPFFTTKDQGKGSGLGLATVYGIVKQLRGHIGVESTPMKGTTFTVHFPETDKPVPQPKAPGVSESLASGSETVLLVEDDEPVRAVSQTVLSRHGYHVLEAAGPKEALVFAARYEGRIDLVLSDVIMPEMTGPEMIARLRTIRPEPPVLYISGYATDALVSDGVLPAGVELITKPIAARDLLFEVRRVLDARGAIPADPGGSSALPATTH